jgi:hypothetical protein
VHVAFEPATAVDPEAVGLLAELLPFGASMADAKVLDALAPARLAVATIDPARQFVLDLGAGHAFARPTAGRCRARCGCRLRRWHD